MLARDLFTWPDGLPFRSHFPDDVPPWAWLPAIRHALAGVRRAVPDGLPPGVLVEGEVWLDPTVRVLGACTLLGPAWIGPGTEIRPGAFVRGQVIAGPGCVLGNSCEFKNALLLDGVQVPHFAYVGDTILGSRAHLGAGVICSNLRLDQQPVTVRGPGGSRHDTGLRKLGALVGDHAEVGCNAVLNPGVVLGRRALVLPTLAFAGYLPEGHIAHVRQRVEFVARRD